MFRDLLSAVRKEASGERALGTVRALARFHRIQASPGYDAAAAWLEGEVRGLGLAPEIIAASGDGRTRYLGMLMPEGWACDRATAILHDGAQASELCDFAREPLSLIQRSGPARGRFPLVALDDGTEPAHYEGREVAGKVVLTAGAVHRVHQLAVIERGAAGLLADGRRLVHPVRGSGDVTNAHHYTSFWWDEDLPRGWGFVVTPERGAALRERLADGAALELEARVETRFFAARVPLLTTTLPGRGAAREEVLVLAHLCHPMPGANDNASGVAAALETARVLAALRARRRWMPRRTVRFLWMPEMTGTRAYLALRAAAAARTVAALNLDMVGADQAQCGSVLLLEHPPHFAASFAEELLSRIRLEALDWVESYSGPGHVSHMRIAEVPYSGGSDHMELVEPAVGVPCPLLIQWPDRFYHSSHDTPERCSPDSLALAVRCAATYVGTLAASGAAETRALAELCTRGAARRWLGALESSDSSAEQRERLRAAAVFASLGRLGTPATAVGAARARFASVTRRWGPRKVVSAKAPAAARRVPVRLQRAPLEGLRHLLPGFSRLAAAERERWREADARVPGGMVTLELAWAACDGRRSLAEIAACVTLESGTRVVPAGRAPSTLESFFERAARLRLSRWKGGA